MKRDLINLALATLLVLTTGLQVYFAWNLVGPHDDDLAPAPTRAYVREHGPMPTAHRRPCPDCLLTHRWAACLEDK